MENFGRETAAINSRKRASSSQLTRPDLLRAKLPTYEQFASKKSDERRGRFKPKSSKHSSAMTVKEASINIALMDYVTEEEGDILKPVRGSSLSLKIKTDPRYDEVLEAALKKKGRLRSQVFTDYAQRICPRISRLTNSEEDAGNFGRVHS